MRTIRLRRLDQTLYLPGTDVGYKIVVIADQAVNMPNEIFRMLRHPVNPNTGEADDTLDGVCSPADLEEYSADAPTEGQDPQWFRVSQVELIFREPCAANDAWTTILQEVRALKSCLDTMDDLRVTETVWIDEEGSSSSSSE